VTLHLYSFQPDLSRLMRLAARERLLPPGDDPGYAVHAVFSASFGEMAPKPWVLLAPRQGGGPCGRLLAYGTAPLELLREHAGTFADPAFTAPLALERAEGRPMPVRFRNGTRLGFRVRIRPVARTGKSIPGHSSVEERGERSRERDVFLARIAAAERATVSTSPEPEGVATAVRAARTATIPSRATCYLEWLDARLRDAGASIGCITHGGGLQSASSARIDSFRFTRLMTRNRSGDRARSQHPIGPDSIVTGTLVVEDADRFAIGVARGIGRFRSFGFGMLLLTPPRG
jgi:CRISPR system Cascade subunit CasE